MLKKVLLKNINKPKWMIEKSYYWSKSYFGLKEDDVIMAFYPKTGSTWVRIFLYNLLSENKEGDTFTFDEVNNTMPNFGSKNFLSEWPFDGVPRFIKTHRNHYNFLYGKNKIVLFMRHPMDVMISYFHYASAKKQLSFDGDFSDLVMHPLMGLENYMKFYSSWIPKAGLTIKYEDMRRDSLATFNNLVKYLELDFTSEQVKTALEVSSLDKTRKAQKISSDSHQNNFKKGFVFARKGSIGEGQAIFESHPELGKYYKTIKAKYNFNFYED